MTRLFLSIAACALLSGCATFGTMPDCADEPAPPAMERESAFLDYAEAVRAAGADCRRVVRTFGRIQYKHRGQ